MKRENSTTFLAQLIATGLTAGLLEQGGLNLENYKL